MVNSRFRMLALALTLSITSGCVVRGNGRYLAYGADAALTTVGVLIATQTDPDPPHDDACSEFCIDDASIRRGIISTGWITAAIGVALACGGCSTPYPSSTRTGASVPSEPSAVAPERSPPDTTDRRSISTNAPV